MVGLQSRPRRRAQILTQQAAETVVLFNLEEGQYYALNEVGGRVWELCDGTRSVAEVIAILGEEYEAPAATIEADVVEVVEELLHEKLLAEDS